MRRTLVVLAVVATAALGVTVLPATAAADGDVTVEQATDGSATVTVTQNGSAVADATVIVESTDENASYAGEGEYATDENGTVALPTPTTGVNVSVTVVYDDDSSSAASAYLAPTDGDEAGDGEEAGSSFGELVSQFVHQARNDTDGGIGPAVATFVLENNPAADVIPDHAGPPTHVWPGNAGPPDHARGDENETQGNGFQPVDVGPPDDAGPPVDRGDGDDGGGGPPDHAGPPEE